MNGVKQTLSVLYRGFLASCNYACVYCPFAKQQENHEQHEKDAIALERFKNWVLKQNKVEKVFFTPWGEALIHPRYQKTIAELSQAKHNKRVVIQTNASFTNTHWLEPCDLSKLALWITFHPTQVPLEQFLSNLFNLHAMGLRFSVGAVAALEHLPVIEALRKALPDSVYLWLNALTPRPRNYYDANALKRLQTIDPLFHYNLKPHASRGHACHTGSSVISLDAHGNAKRCHFTTETIGNIYQENLRLEPVAFACGEAFCDCHIGFVHLQRLGLYEVFVDGVLERIPACWLG